MWRIGICTILEPLGKDHCKKQGPISFQSSQATRGRSTWLTPSPSLCQSFSTNHCLQMRLHRSARVCLIREARTCQSASTWLNCRAALLHTSTPLSPKAQVKIWGIRSTVEMLHQPTSRSSHSFVALSSFCGACSTESSGGGLSFTLKERTGTLPPSGLAHRARSHHATPLVPRSSGTRQAQNGLSFIPWRVTGHLLLPDTVPAERTGMNSQSRLAWGFGAKTEQLLKQIPGLVPL